MIEYYYLWILLAGICIYAWVKKDRIYLLSAALVGIFIVIVELDISANIKVWLIVGLTLLFFLILFIKVLRFAKRIKKQD